MSQTRTKEEDGCNNKREDGMIRKEDINIVLLLLLFILFI